MAKDRTISGVLGSWQRLLAPLQANASDIPHLEVPRTKLEGLLAQAVAINKDQGARRASKQELSKQLKTMMVDGERLASLLRAGVKEHYGVRSEKLAEFGLQPFRGLARKAKPAEGSDTPAPAQSPPSVAPKPAADPGHDPAH